jgi:hypothetical protein
MPEHRMKRIIFLDKLILWQQVNRVLKGTGSSGLVVMMMNPISYGVSMTQMLESGSRTCQNTLITIKEIKRNYTKAESTGPLMYFLGDGRDQPFS